MAYLMTLHNIDTNDITDIGTTVPKNVIGAQIDLKNICPCSESEYYRVGPNLLQSVSGF